ncbi:MAG: hypothetical protein Q7S33_00940 [Nanoarchaeota archaeon]|nr:hypothetical protein [Nanoarchaeota archaeon]
MVKNKRVDKKALSPVIATILLVMLVLVLAIIIFLWARGFISEQVEKKGQPIESACGQVDFTAKKVEGNVEIRNNGNVPFIKIAAKYFDKYGSSTIYEFKDTTGVYPKVLAGGSASIPLSWAAGDHTSATEIIIYPILIGNVKGEALNKKEYTCIEQGIKIKG